MAAACGIAVEQNWVLQQPTLRMSQPKQKLWRIRFAVSLLLFLPTAALYWEACGNAFVSFDDGEYVYENPMVLNGLRGDGVKWALTTNHAGNWHPLTWASLQLDAQLFGPAAAGFHRTNVLLHALNAALVFLALEAMSGAVWQSALVAAIFAVHPLRVESVAWVAERKDVLSAFLFLLTLLAYVRYAAAPSIGRYSLVAIVFALALMAKPMLVTLPCVLLLLDYWPLRRLGAEHEMRGKAVARSRVILEKIPLLTLSAAVAGLTLFAQTGGKIDCSFWFPLRYRAENALVSYADYLGQTFWPVDLAAFYPHPYGGLSILRIAGAAALLAAVTGLAAHQAKRRPYLLVGWLWFLGMLVPVIGLIQVGRQARADRYTYLPHLGLFLAVVWAASEFAFWWRWGRTVGFAAAVAALIACGVLTIGQIQLWHDEQTLWEHAWTATQGNYFAGIHLSKLA